MSAEVVALRRGVSTEPWITKAQLAAYLGRSTRWIELMAREGLPSRMIGGRRGYRPSEVDAWIEGRFT
jgi:predicted DNA-binding transcriptional regulator AlpA